MSKREASIKRDTKETQIQLAFAIDGSGKSEIDTGIGFFDHMLTLFAAHGHFDLTVKVKGDLEVDGHHTTEDVGICLGQAIQEAMGDAAGITRYADALIPMDEALCQMAVDLSNRPHLGFDVPNFSGQIGQFDAELVEEFFHALINNARFTCHIQVLKGRNLHHIAESIFKAFARVLSQALSKDPRQTGIPSTKGVL